MKRLMPLLLALLIALSALPAAFAAEAETEPEALYGQMEVYSEEVVDAATASDYLASDPRVSGSGESGDYDATLYGGVIMTEPAFAGSVWEYGEPIYIPFAVYGTDYTYVSDYHYVVVYNADGEVVASYKDLFTQTPLRKLVLRANPTWTYEPGTYYVECYSTFYESTDVYPFFVEEEANPGNVTTYTNNHFQLADDGAQYATPGRFYSAWDTNLVDAPDGVPDYAVRLTDLYIGAVANDIVEAENVYNTNPPTGLQWLLMGFDLTNRGTGTLCADDVFNGISASYAYFTNYGQFMTIMSSASFAGDLDDMGIYDVELSAGQTGKVWLGLLVKTNQGLPDIMFDTAAYNGNDAIFLRTDPTFWDHYNTWAIASNGQTVYLDNNGNPVTGWNTIEGVTYYFDENGYLGNGLALGDAWYYVVNGEVVTDYTGLVEYNGVWFYVNAGRVDFDYTGLILFNDAWMYISGGQVDWNYVGLVQYNGAWLYVSGGMVDWNYTGLAALDGKLHYVSGGMLSADYNGLLLHNDVWYYLVNGVVDTDYTGLTLYNGVWMYVSGGQVDWSYTGLVLNGDAWVYIAGGMANADYTGLVQYGDALYYVSEGTVKTDYTGLALYNDVWYYVSDGQVDATYTGLTLFNGVWFYVNAGQVDFGYTGLVLFNGVWMYVSAGQVDWNYEGMTFFNGTWFYVSGGSVNWDYVGLTCYNGVWFYIAGGMVDWSYNSLTLFNGTWFYISGGMVDWNYTGLVYFNGVEFYVSGGMVDWSFNGPVGDKNVVGGMVVA